MSKVFSGYPKIYNLGHKALELLFKGPVLIQEKVDGSQFNFMVDDAGKITIRSRRAEIHVDGTNKMFQMATDAVARLAGDGKLLPNMVYRGEAITSPKHNSLHYDNVPPGGIVLFDITTPLSWECMDYDKLVEHAQELGLLVVPTLVAGEPELDGDILSSEYFKELIDRESFLGGPKMEGVVIKNYNVFGPDGKPIFGKYVSSEFKETNEKNWKKQKEPITDVIIEMLRNEQRWVKAAERLRDSGELANEPKDIGPLMREVSKDIEAECIAEIKDMLYTHYRKGILRAATSPVPQWYKDRLLKKQFGELDE